MGRLDMCCVKHCKKRRDLNPELSFFKIPKSPADRHEAWLKFTGRKSAQKNSWKICSSHFMNGKPSKKETDVDYVPSLNAPRKSSKTAGHVVPENGSEELAKMVSEIKQEREAGEAEHSKLDIQEYGCATANTASLENMEDVSATEAEVKNEIQIKMEPEDQDVVSDCSSDSEGRVQRSKNRQDAECKTCGKKFKYLSKLKAHLKVHEQPGKTYKCQVCNEVYSLFRDVKRHEREVHEELRPARRYMCDICGHRFHSSTNLGDHRRLHTGELPFQCTECGKFFRRKSDLRIHERMKHNEAQEGMFPCVECKKNFATKSRLLQHMNKHVEESGENPQVETLAMAPLACPVCGKKFFTNSRLKLHLDTHAGTVHQCPYCSKNFLHRPNLISHIRGLHEDDSKYKCSYCSRKFGNKYNLKVHERIHSGERPYTCPYCQKGFADVCNFRRHEQKCKAIKTGEYVEEEDKDLPKSNRRGLQRAKLIASMISQNSSNRNYEIPTEGEDTDFDTFNSKHVVQDKNELDQDTENT